MDLLHAEPVSARLIAPVRSALRGDAVSWPSDLTDAEIGSLLDHGIGPLLYATHPLPRLRTAAIRAAALEPLRADDARAVLGALAAAGLGVLITKGTALAYDLYPAPELRPRSDTDLLVTRRDLPAALDVFRSLGFSIPRTSGDEHAVRQVTLSRTDEWGAQHDYDLHWEVTNTPVLSSVLQFDELRSNAIPIPRLGPAAWGLCDVDALLLACIHRVAHHHDTDRLLWLVDIAMLRARMTAESHHHFWRRAAEAKVVGVCDRSIALADEWLSGAPHDRAADWLQPHELGGDEPSRLFLDRDLTYGEETFANFRALSWRARWQRAWQLAFPPPSFVLQSFGESSRMLLPWLYLRRGARGVARLFRRF